MELSENLIHIAINVLRCKNFIIFFKENQIMLSHIQAVSLPVAIATMLSLIL